MNVAALAGLPPSVISRASVRATDIEHELSGHKRSQHLAGLVNQVLKHSNQGEAGDVEVLKTMQSSTRELLKDVCV